MTKEYEIVKTVNLTFTVYAENEEEAKDMAWDYDDRLCSDYSVDNIEVECLEDEEE
tara:strand:+ start:412 stop:579 length:168 start_codon:yes stop_codon:yes gene_type:complete